mmetsp:Transcript_159819/g.297966  ORF Transcript_159819/g.297966 Transcript_159819/m.297966 type:complete len:350 (-) Transcript_159819:89-1138(-)
MSNSLRRHQLACLPNSVASVLLAVTLAVSALSADARTSATPRVIRPVFLSRGGERAFAAPAPAAAGGCSAACKEANKIWKEAAKAEALRVQLAVNATRTRFIAETKQLSEEVRNQVTAAGSSSSNNLRASLGSAIKAEAGALKKAVALSGQQVMAAEQTRFDEMARHQQELALAVQQGIVKHGYKVAAEETPKWAKKAGESFKGFEKKIEGSFINISQAWNASYKESQIAAKAGWNSWSKAHNALNETWSNITGSFAKTNAAAAVAQGLGPDLRWIKQAVRMQADLQAAAHAAAHAASFEAVEAQEMADKVSAVVQGNTDALPKLEAMLDDVETQANEANVAATSESSD